MKIKFSKIFFYIIYALTLATNMLSEVTFMSSAFSLINKSFLFIGVIIFLVQSPKYNKKKFLMMATIFAVVIINYFITDDALMIKLFILIMIFKDINFNKFIKFDLFIKIIYYVLVICLCKARLAENIITYRSDGSVRQALGFGHSNTLGLYTMSICFDYIYLRYKKLKIWDLIFTAFFMFLIFKITNCRTAVLGFGLLIIGILIVKLTKKMNISKNGLKKIIPFIPIFCSALSIVCVLLYGKYDFIYTIDSLLSGRIRYGRYFWEEYGINLFGNVVTFISTQQAALYNTSAEVLDNSYLKLLIQFGGIIFIIYNYLSYKSLKYLVNKEKDSSKEILLIILITFYILGISETWLIKFYFNNFILYIAMYIYNKKLSDDKDKDFTKKENINFSKENNSNLTTC